jgi:hypothetical protein
VKSVYPLTLPFNQPEGLAFDNLQNVHISNERGQKSSATILVFASQHK